MKESLCLIFEIAIFGVVLILSDEVLALFVLINQASDIRLHLALQKLSAINLFFQLLDLTFSFGNAGIP